MTGPSADSAAATIAVPTTPVEPVEVPAVLSAAVEPARAAVTEFSGADTVGEHLGVDYEDPTAATHRFAAQLPGYQGWQWAVVVAAIPGSQHVTVSEVVLVPGPTALLAPEWVPWNQRVRPGDLGPGDLLAPPEDDPRLVPGYVSSGDSQLDEVAGELGLGRRRLLSPVGRADAAERWHFGAYGPESPMARSTKRVCRDCGFYLPLAGSLGRMFGVCANAMSADGRVVDAGYGCGAHSDTPQPPLIGSPTYQAFDDGMIEVVPVTPPVEVEAPVAEAEAPVAEAEVEAAAVEVGESAEAVEVAESAESAEAVEVAESPESAEAVEVGESAEVEVVAEAVAETAESMQPEPVAAESAQVEPVPATVSTAEDAQA